MNYLLILPLLLAIAPLAPPAAEASSKMQEIATDPSKIDRPAKLKILIAKGLDNALVEVKGKYKLFNPVDGSFIHQGSSRLSLFEPELTGLNWAKHYPEIFQMRVVPLDKDSTFFIDGIQYQGQFEVYNIEGKLSIVAEVAVENYLNTFLTENFSHEKRKEVIEALAITLRTDLYYQTVKNSDAMWHINARDARYNGSLNYGQNARVSHAVDLTEQLILTLDGAPFATAFSENCGGKTASYSKIYRKSGAETAGVDAPFAARDRNKFIWRSSASLDDLTEKLSSDEPITSIDLFQDKESKKVYGARLHTANGHHDIDFFTLQKALGDKKIASTDFTLEIKDDKVQFQGYGKGNGVGLCLFSASCMASEGKSASEILALFFPGTKIEKVKKPAQ